MICFYRIERESLRFYDTSEITSEYLDVVSEDYGFTMAVTMGKSTKGIRNGTGSSCTMTTIDMGGARDFWGG